MPCDVKEDAHRSERDDEARPAVGDEREGDPGQRSEPEHGREVDERLSRDERRKADCEPLAERVSTAKRDAKARVRKRDVGSDRQRRSEQAELLADRGEDHVRVRLGQVVVLEDALPDPGAENPA
jgi:hypothetical protein